MAHLIDKDAVLTIIEQLKDEAIDMEDKARWFLSAALTRRIEALEVKEVDLEKETREYLSTYWSKEKELHPFLGHIAKHFFEFGLSVNNPITAVDRGVAEEIIINLKRVEGDYRIDLTKEMEWVRNKVKK